MDGSRTEAAVKPLGIKAYGSIPHLLGSRSGPGDHHVSWGQHRIATEKARDRHDVVIVQEKLDGSCCAVARIGDDIVALGRAGYPARSSRFEQHQLFADWVEANRLLFLEILKDSQRIVGEWLAQAHGTQYALKHEPFVAFDLMEDQTRTPALEFYERVGKFLPVPHIIHTGGPFPVEEALKALSGGGFHGALDPVEGAVWRVERGGEVDFLAKYVRPDKEDGRYLPEIAGGEATWNWRPEDGKGGMLA